MSAKKTKHETAGRSDTKRVFSVLTGSRNDKPEISLFTYLFLIGIAILALGLGIWMGVRAVGRMLYSQHPKFSITDPVKDIEIVGADPALERQLREVLSGFRPPRASDGQERGIGAGFNIFSFRLKDLHDYLAQSSGLRFVRVGRKLPQTLVVEVEKRQPIVRQYGRPDAVFLAADEEGVVFNARGVDLAEFPELVPYGDNRWRPSTRFASLQEKAAFEFLDAMSDPSVHLDVLRLDARPETHLDVIIEWGGTRISGSLAWDGMGRGSKRAQAALRHKLKLLKNRLAGLDGRSVLSFNATVGERIAIEER